MTADGTLQTQQARIMRSRRLPVNMVVARRCFLIFCECFAFHRLPESLYSPDCLLKSSSLLFNQASNESSVIPSGPLVGSHSRICPSIPCCQGSRSRNNNRPFVCLANGIHAAFHQTRSIRFPATTSGSGLNSSNFPA